MTDSKEAVADDQWEKRKVMAQAKSSLTTLINE